MAINLFGFLLKRKDPPKAEAIPSFAPPADNDGALTFTGTMGFGGFGTYLDLENAAKSEADLVTRYRMLALQPEADAAISEVVNEAIVDDEDEDLVSIDLDEIEELPESLKDKIQKEFRGVLDLLKFELAGYSIFQRWYVDGRCYYHLLVDKDKISEGIQEIRYIDPRKIRKVREILKQPPGSPNDPGDQFKQIAEYFLYNEQGFGSNKGMGGGSNNQSGPIRGIKIAKDAITYATSGVIDETGSLMLGYLHGAIKPLNQLRALEDSVVIYRLTRAPERRIWYIDVGNLPRSKAEAYMRENMTRHRMRLNYDATSGQIMSDSKYMNMTEDYWLARGSGDRGTKVETLPAGDITGKIEDVLFFQKRLYKALQVPISRLMPEDLYMVGRPSEISREEVKFSKFIARLRRRFAQSLFSDMLGKQLALKGMMDPDDWDKIQPKVTYRFARDNLYAEFRDAEIWASRAQTMQGLGITNPVGHYISHETIRTKVLKQTDEEMEEENKKIAEEKDDPQYEGMDPTQQQAEMPGFGAEAGGAEIPEEPMPKPPPVAKPPGAGSPAGAKPKPGPRA